jgi:hypothetical protein
MLMREAKADYRIAACRRKGWNLAMLAMLGRDAASAWLRVAPVPRKRAFAPLPACGAWEAKGVSHDETLEACRSPP